MLQKKDGEKKNIDNDNPEITFSFMTQTCILFYENHIVQQDLIKSTFFLN